MAPDGKSGAPSPPPAYPDGAAAAAAAPGAAAHPEAPPSYEQTVSGSGFKDNAKGTPGSYYAPPPPPPPGAPTLVVHQYVAAPNFGHRPVDMICPHCQCQVRTSIESEPGPMAWVLAAILCVVGFGLCACIPCCIDTLNVVTHKCPNCNNFLGRYKGGV